MQAQLNFTPEHIPIRLIIRMREYHKIWKCCVYKLEVEK